jgi:hypothetical protein
MSFVYVYHYHAMFVNGAEKVSIDGIAKLGMPVANVDLYRKLKMLIIKNDSDLCHIDPSRLIICSLSLLSKEEV